MSARWWRLAAVTLALALLEFAVWLDVTHPHWRW